MKPLGLLSQKFVFKRTDLILLCKLKKNRAIRIVQVVSVSHKRTNLFPQRRIYVMIYFYELKEYNLRIDMH